MNSSRTGRPRGFEEVDVVRRAKRLFWARGYASTSVQDLVDATDLGRGSLYGAFGDKRELYQRALDEYCNSDGVALTGMLAGPGEVLARVEATLLAVVAAAAEHPGRGCLLVNTTSELVPHDAEATRLVRATFDGLEEAFRTALHRARDAGETRDDLDIDASAALLLTFLQGLQVVGKADRDPQRLRRAVEALIAGLR